MQSPLPLRSSLPWLTLRVLALAAPTLVVGLPSAFADIATLTAIQVSPPDSSVPIEFPRRFTALATYSDESTADVTTLVAWSSSDPSVATISNVVDSKGLAISLATGTTEIRADLGGVTGRATLTVTDDRLVAIEVRPLDPIIAVGAIKNFIAVGHYLKAADRNLTQTASWFSSDPSVASVTNAPPTKSRVTGLALGTTEIRAQFGTVSGATTLTVGIPPVSCAGGPFGCAAPGRASLTIENRADDQSDLLRFTWALGAATSTELGNPPADTGYRVCVWDWIGNAPQLVMDMQAPPAGDCHGRPCWKPRARGGFHYRNRSRQPNGLDEIIVHSGPLGLAFVRVRGRGPALPDPPMPFAQEPKITLQVVNDAGACWGAEFSTPADVNTAQKLVVKKRVPRR